MNDAYETGVFINCPFDASYRPIFEAIVFCVADCGYRPRCALEADDSGEVRVEKILNIVSGCRFGIHDLSRTELDGATGLPRFNMPLELGFFLAAKRFGAGKQKRKRFASYSTASGIATRSSFRISPGRISAAMMGTSGERSARSVTGFVRRRRLGRSPVGQRSSAGMMCSALISRLFATSFGFARRNSLSRILCTSSRHG